MIVNVVVYEFRAPQWKAGGDGFEYSAYCSITCGDDRIEVPTRHVHTAWRARWNHKSHWRPEPKRRRWCW